jgi:tetratricopeptide (TPR) repeat protein/predicted Ser/Thr protein kinase
VWGLPEHQRAEQLAVASRDPQLRETLQRYLASATQCMDGEPGTEDPARTVLRAPDDGPAPQPYPEQLETYRVVRRIGAGGMGEVLEGYDERLHRRVALKMIRADALARDDVRSRFLREARVLSSLNHPNICAIYDYLEQEHGSVLVLEYIDGQPLTKVVGRLRRASVLLIAEQIARVLVAAHAAGVVHRDLKPDNVMLTPGGDAKVLDFGIARSVSVRDQLHPAGAARHEPVVTMAGTIAGTPAYMSPEQALGRECTAASDMCSFGLLLQELVTGRPPRDPSASTDQTLAAAAAGESADPAIGGSLGRLIRDLKSLEPSKRPTAIQAADRIRRIRSKPRRMATYAGAALLCVLGVGGVAKYTVDIGRQRSTAVAARGSAESLVSLLVDRMRDKLVGAGRLDVLEEASHEVQGYYGSLPADSLEPAQVRRLANALQLEGEVLLNKGNLPGAREAFANECAMLTTLVAANPSDGGILKLLGASHFYLGAVALQAKNLAEAKQQWDRYHEIAKKLVSMDEHKAEWQLELAYSQANLVQLAMEQGQHDRAVALLDDVLATKQRLVELEPANNEFRRSLANSLTQLSDTQRQRGELEAACKAAERAVGAMQAIVQSGPPDVRDRHQLAVTHNKLGQLRQRLRQHDQAIASFQSAQDVVKGLLELEPANTQWQYESAWPRSYSARSARRLGDLNRAASELAAGRAVFERLIASDPTNANWMADAIEVDCEEARLALAQKDTAAAGKAMARAWGRVPAQSQTPTDKPALLAPMTLAKLNIGSGDVEAALGRQEQAGEHWREAAKALLTLTQSTRVQEIRAGALLRLGQNSDAEPILQDLRSKGPLPEELEDLLKS